MTKRSSRLRLLLSVCGLNLFSQQEFLLADLFCYRQFCMDMFPFGTFIFSTGNLFDHLPA